MSTSKRPISVTVLALVYVAVGTVGFVYHFHDALSRPDARADIVLIEVTELLAIVCGVFLLRGHNWARWGALLWIAFHVVVSAFHALPEFAMHALICAIIGFLLFRPGAGRYFRGPGMEAT